jgi:UDP-N-acetylmuramoylalanine--D-glutamate ligase
MDTFLTGKRVTVAGLGATAVALVRLLKHAGALPFVTEAGAAAGRETHLAALEAMGAPYETGGHSESAFTEAALIVPSPGVPPGIAPIAAARARGAEVLGEMEVASRFCTSKVLAVTGTNGKTTTTELLHAMVKAAGRTCALAGNNEQPFSAAVLVTPAPEFIVLEVSSYQLETAETFAPRVGAVLNITPDHLARHGTLEEYARVKSTLFARQGPGHTAVVNADCPWARAMPVPEGVRRVAFSRREHVEDGPWLDGETIRWGEEAFARRGDVRLPGAHNLENALAALAMAEAAGLDREAVLEALRVFPGVEHRIEHVAEMDGVAWFNDSKSTNVDSLKVALESFDGPIVLLAGGQGKGTGYDGLANLVRQRVKTLVAFGEDAPRLEAGLASATNVVRVTNMAEAVAYAQACASPGDVVLLSPGCASFDQYRNFEERGRDFKARVLQLTPRKKVLNP